MVLPARCHGETSRQYHQDAVIVSRCTNVQLSATDNKVQGSTVCFTYTVFYLSVLLDNGSVSTAGTVVICYQRPRSGGKSLTHRLLLDETLAMMVCRSI